MMSDEGMSLTAFTGLEVFLPNGRRLGRVHDAVIDAVEMSCSHLFIRETDKELVEGGVHLAVPWRWIRAIDDIVLLRWFPETPIPLSN